MIAHSTVDDQKASENFRAIQADMDRRPAMRQVTVERYTAVGSTAARIPVASGSRPWSVMLARCVEAAAEDGAVISTPVLNYVWDPTTEGLGVFEPDGLVANTVYKLEFLVIEVMP